MSGIDTEKLQRMRGAAPLLPEPGGEVVVELLDEIDRLRAENARLRRAVSDLTLDKMILAEAAKGNF